MPETPDAVVTPRTTPSITSTSRPTISAQFGGLCIIYSLKAYMEEKSNGQ